MINSLPKKTLAYKLLEKHGLAGHAETCQAADRQLHELLQTGDHVPDTDHQNRRDLRHLRSFAIDGRNTDVVDDAISYDKSTGKMYLHIADPTRFFQNPASDPIVLEALRKVSTVYTGFTTATNIDMFPSRLTEDFVSLCGPKTGGKALSFGCRVLEDGALGDVSVEASLISFPRRMSYAIADHSIANRLSEELLALHRLALVRHQYRREMGADLGSAKRKAREGLCFDSMHLVSELSLVAGEVAARFAHRNGIAVPFRGQRRDGNKLQPSEVTLHAQRHSGLGLAHYLKVTSPLRSSVDLLAHFQIKAVLRGELPPFVARVLRGEIARANATLRKVAAYAKDVRFGKAGQARRNAAIAEGRVRKETVATKSAYVEKKTGQSCRRTGGKTLERRTRKEGRNWNWRKPIVAA